MFVLMPWAAGLSKRFSGAGAGRLGGAGTGATVGKFYGPFQAVKSGQGSASCCYGNLVVAALVVVNAFGDIYDRRGKLIAGPRTRKQA